MTTRTMTIQICFDDISSHPTLKSFGRKKKSNAIGRSANRFSICVPSAIGYHAAMSRKRAIVVFAFVAVLLAGAGAYVVLEDPAAPPTELHRITRGMPSAE